MISLGKGGSVTLRLLGQSCKINTRSAKFSGKKMRAFTSTDDKIVYNCFLGKLKYLLNHGFPRPILSLKHSLGKIGLAVK